MAFKSISPHQPTDVIGEFEEAGERSVRQTVARASEAFREWREQSAVARGAAL